MNVYEPEVVAGKIIKAQNRIARTFAKAS